MAEAIMNLKGFPNFTGFSAGSHPTGTVNPEALHQLAAASIPTEGLRSKNWDEFARPDAPRCILSSPYAIERRRKCARCGPENR